MSRIGDIAIGIIIGVGGIIGAALAWDKYGNSNTADDSLDSNALNNTPEDTSETLKEENNAKLPEDESMESNEESSLPEIILTSKMIIKT